MDLHADALHLGDDYVEVHVTEAGNYLGYITGKLTSEDKINIRSYSQTFADGEAQEIMDAVGDISKLQRVVESKNMMSGKTIRIPEEHKGTAMDPSQERYWAM